MTIQLKVNSYGDLEIRSTHYIDHNYELVLSTSRPLGDQVVLWTTAQGFRLGPFDIRRNDHRVNEVRDLSLVLMVRFIETLDEDAIRQQHERALAMLVTLKEVILVHYQYQDLLLESIFWPLERGCTA